MSAVNENKEEATENNASEVKPGSPRQSKSPQPTSPAKKEEEQPDQTTKGKRQAEMFKKYIDQTGIAMAFQIIFAEILDKKLDESKLFSYTAMRLRQIGEDLQKIKLVVEIIVRVVSDDRWHSFRQINRGWVVYILMLQRTMGSEERQINHQLRQYHKINSSLRKKLKEKDSKIQQLFGYIQEAGRQHRHSPQNQPTKQSQLQHHPKSQNALLMSEGRRKQKENSNHDAHQEQKYPIIQDSIFRHPSQSVVSRHSRIDVHLPSLERKFKGSHIFQAEDGSDNPERKKKVVRIAMEKLKPLNLEEVKLRFLRKYEQYRQ